MVQALLAIHLLTALIIIGLILMQQGKGAEAGASFGAGASQTIFGSAGSWNFFSRMTAIFATVFFVTSIALAVIAKDKAVVEDADIPAVEEADIPAAPPANEIPALDSSSNAEIPVMDQSAPQDAIPQAGSAEQFESAAPAAEQSGTTAPASDGSEAATDAGEQQ